MWAKNEVRDGSVVLVFVRSFFFFELTSKAICPPSRTFSTRKKKKRRKIMKIIIGKNQMQRWFPLVADWYFRIYLNIQLLFLFLDNTKIETKTYEPFATRQHAFSIHNWILNRSHWPFIGDFDLSFGIMCYKQWTSI